MKAGTGDTLEWALVRLWGDLHCWRLARGDYPVELAFTLPEARTIREKAIAAASVSCGRSKYLQPILPPVARMARAPAFTIQPSANPITFSVPRIAGAIGSQAEARRTLSCVR